MAPATVLLYSLVFLAGKTTNVPLVLYLFARYGKAWIISIRKLC